MASKKVKQKILLAPDALPAFFRNLARFWETGEGNEEVFFSMDSFSKLEIKRKEAAPEAKVQIQITHEPVPMGEKKEKPDKEKFKSIKKRMKKQFKAISRLLDQGELPGAEAVSQFAGDYRKMHEQLHPDSEDIRPRLALCQALEDGVKAQDLEGVAKAVADLKAEEVACHKALK